LIAVGTITSHCQDAGRLPRTREKQPGLAYWDSELNSMGWQYAVKVGKKMGMLLWDEKESLTTNLRK